MRVLLIVAFILAVVAVIAFAGTAVAGLAGGFWLSAAIAVYFLDLLVGGWAIPINAQRSGRV